MKLTREIRKQLVKRVKSFGWRVAVMSVVILLDFGTENAAGIEIPDVLTVIIGLVSGELTKYLNRK